MTPSNFGRHRAAETDNPGGHWDMLRLSGGVSVERIETAPKSRIWAPPLRGGPAPPKPEGIPPHPKGGQRFAVLHVKNPLSRAFFSIVALEESSFSHILPNLA